MDPWQFIAVKLSAAVDVMLLYVLESKGSSPGRQGFKMAVAADGSICGTIGGGIMEHKFVELARANLSKTSDPAVYKQVHDKAAGNNQSGMICSGEQTIFLYKVKKQDEPQLHALIQSLQKHQNGTLELTNEGIRFSNDAPASNYYFKQQDDRNFIFREKTGYKNQLHIIGGGHCSLALSALMRDMDFYITVYDERKGLNTMEQNSFAHEQILVDSYAVLGNIIPGGDNVYVVIMTFGYRTDDMALRALLKRSFKYLGVLGSKKKMEKLFEELRNENTDEKLLAHIHAPIGIQVKSQTTPEIAVSIAAEIISIKNSS